MSVAKNTAFLTGASIVQKALSFVYFRYLAHYYGADTIGQYTYALAFTTICSILVDGGLTQVLIRTIAKDPQHARATFKRVLLYKGGFLIVTLGIMLVIALTYARTREVAGLIAAATLVMVLDSVNLTVYGVLRGFQNLVYESVGVIITQCVAAGFGIMSAVVHFPIVIPILGLACASGINLLVGITGLRRTPGLHQSDAHHPTPVPLIKEAIPFALAGIFARGYSFLDSLILGSYSFVDTGIYSVANKLTFAFQFLPLALSASLYPAFSQTLHTHPDESRVRWHQGERYLLVVALLICSGIVALRRQLLGFYGTEYVTAETTLLILAGSLVFSFLSYPVGALLNAGGKQHLQTAAMACTLAVNAALNFILIPRFGPIGAAVSAFAGNMMLFMAGAVFVQRKVIQLPWRSFARDAARAVFCAIIAGLAMVGVAYYAHWLIAGVVGVVVYAGCIVATNTLPRAEILGFINRLKKV